LAIQPEAPSGEPREPRSAGAQPRPWQPAATSAQLDLVRRWQRLLRADAGQFRSAHRPRRTKPDDA
jgi:hypothetical protein